MAKFSISGLFNSEKCKEGFIFSSFFSFLTKFLSFFINVLIAYYFGSNHSTDIYFYSISIIFIISSFLVSLNTTIILPQAMRIRANAGNEESINFINSFFYTFTALSLVITFLVGTNPVYFFSLFSKFSITLLELNISILKFCILLLPLMVINSFLLDVLVSYRLFTSSVILSFLNSVFCFLFIMIFHKKIGVLSLLLGNIAANFIQAIIQFAILLKNFKWSFGFSFSCFNKKLINNCIVAQLGNFISFVSAYFPMYMLSNLKEGVITSFNYGQKVTDIITSLITVQFASIVGIKLNELYAEKNFNEINRVFKRSAENLVFILVPVSICVSIYSKDIIKILFQHGAFDEKTSELASSYLMISIIAVPFIALNSIVARLFMSAQKINRSVFFQIGIGLFMIFTIYFGITKLGPLGYPIAYLFSYIVNIVSVYFVIKYAIPAVNYLGILKDVIVVLMINLPVAVVIYMLHEFSGGQVFFTLAGPVIFFIGVLGINGMTKFNKEIWNLTISGLKRIAIWKKSP